MSIELLDINHRDAIIDAFDKTKRQYFNKKLVGKGLSPIVIENL